MVALQTTRLSVVMGRNYEAVAGVQKMQIDTFPSSVSLYRTVQRQSDILPSVFTLLPYIYH